MADITPDAELERPGREAASEQAQDTLNAGPRLDGDRFRIIELLFFAYRDFTADADDVLAELDFGRAHHRALHFICRHPGIRVADLLEILKITKQSLARVLKDLRDRGFIMQIRGHSDRRERLLYPRAAGIGLIERLAQRQSERINAALEEAGDDARETVERFLFTMIRAEERADVAKLLAGGEILGGVREENE
jgi:DNA-binding MarR family transcriptional regulator